jgi:hypothetical protein
VQAAQVEVGQGAEQRLQRQELDVGAGLAQVVDAEGIVGSLHADARPHVLRPVKRVAQFEQPRGPLRQDLEPVPGRLPHRLEDLLDEVGRNLLVEQVAHRADEDGLGLLPPQRQVEEFGVNGQLEPIGVSLLAHALQPPSHALGVAVLAPRADFVAAGDGVPGRLGPLDGRLAH